MTEQTESSIYRELLAERDAVNARGKLGRAAILASAYHALQAGEISREEYDALFGGDAEVPEPRQPVERTFDHAQRAAGEAVRSWDEDK